MGLYGVVCSNDAKHEITRCELKSLHRTHMMPPAVRLVTNGWKIIFSGFLMLVRSCLPEVWYRVGCHHLANLSEFREVCLSVFLFLKMISTSSIILDVCVFWNMYCRPPVSYNSDRVTPAVRLQLFATILHGVPIIQMTIQMCMAVVTSTKIIFICLAAKALVTMQHLPGAPDVTGNAINTQCLSCIMCDT